MQKVISLLGFDEGDQNLTSGQKLSQNDPWDIMDTAKKKSAGSKGRGRRQEDKSPISATKN